ncbi:MAG: beta-eliminating lyase-related protein [Myxococcota bacterium]
MNNDALMQYRKALFARCQSFNGHPPQKPAAFYEMLAHWCRDHEVDFDRYGVGTLNRTFEAKIAALLGFEAGRFMPSGTMAQGIAMKIWSDRAHSPHIGFHPTAHQENYEYRGYTHLYNLKATLVGTARSPLLDRHLEAVPEQLAALQVELPLRDAGGLLPSWEELEALKRTAHDRGIRLHLDGARLWECAAWYERDYTTICEGFDSCYVSFYKGIGAPAGSMLLGTKTFIEQAKVWQKRCGGNLHTQTGNVASAAMLFETRIVKMPAYYARACTLAETLRKVEGLRLVPERPQVNLFHIYLPLPPDIALRARDQVAEETSVFLFTWIRPAQVPGFSTFELYVGDKALAVDDTTIEAAFERLLEVGNHLLHGEEGS